MTTQPALQLPTDYRKLGRRKAFAREAYIQFQEGACCICSAPIHGEPDPLFASYPLNLKRFPPGFLDHPIHLHHDKETGMTIGAAHAQCNGVSFEIAGV